MSKAPKKDAGAQQPMIVDKTKYFRQPIAFPDYKADISTSSSNKRKLCQADLLLPEWNIKINDEVPWSGTFIPPDESLLLELGKKISTLQDYYGDAFPKTTTLVTPSEKKDKKDKKADTSPRPDIFLNKQFDDQGNRLPQVKQTNEPGSVANSQDAYLSNILESFELSKQFFSVEQQSNAYLCLAFNSCQYLLRKRM